MKREQLPLYALAVAVLVVGLAALGVPIRTMLVALAALACPLMMIFMMGGMHGGHGHGGSDRRAEHSSASEDEHRDERSTLDR